MPQSLNAKCGRAAECGGSEDKISINKTVNHNLLQTMGLMALLAEPIHATTRPFDVQPAGVSADHVGHGGPPEVRLLGTVASPVVTLTTDTTLLPGDTTYEGMNLIVSQCTLTVSGSHSFSSLRVASNGVVTHPPSPTGGAVNALDLTIERDATLELGGRMDLSGLGYGAQAGPGQGAGAFYGGSGAGHGGEGGGLGGTNYGSVLAPVDFGSGGGNGGYGPGGAGGGRVRLNVGGTLTVAGQILANGQNIGGGYGAGGAGGSVYLTVGTLAGGGEIQANGGAGANGGGGGRIALHFSTNTFTGRATAFGGAGTGRGGAGTIYGKLASDSVGQVRVDNGGEAGAPTSLSAPAGYHLTVTHGGSVRPAAILNLASLHVAASGRVIYPAGQPGFTSAVAGDVTIESGGAILASCALTVQGNLFLAADGAISADGQGFGSSVGPGPGLSDYYHASGAGHGGPGGTGAVEGGPVYGAVLRPVDLGSGGGSAGVCGGGCPGGAGGGAIRLVVGGTLTVDGPLSANGLGGAGGGSGGSVFVTAGTLSGSGRIAAVGGATGDNSSGGGGGGRIALYCADPTFAGSISAVGGQGGAASGGPGTIYRQSDLPSAGTLLVDGTGRTNAMETPISTPLPCALVLSNATILPVGTWRLGSLLLATNATITHPVGGPRIRVIVLGDATIAAGSGFAVSGRGHGSTQGPGHGNGSYYHGSGAGHGQAGGSSTDSAGDVLPGGVAYGSERMPVDLGSGGGSAGVCGPCPGGAGGGAIELTVHGTLLLNGQLNANGKPGAGGGSGGSVWLTVGRLIGEGSIDADGGATGTWQGGGSGGRIAIYSGVNDFGGTTTANGGSSGTVGLAGGTGTIHLAADLPPVFTRDTTLPAGDLTYEGQSIVVSNCTLTVQGPHTLASLWLTAGAVLTQAPPPAGEPDHRLDLTVTGDLTIDGTSRVDVNAKGFGPTAGPGAGMSSGSYPSGGGHGGPGGDSYGGPLGGGSHDDLLAPTLAGSGGGDSLNFGTGGAGGGAIRLTVGGVLTVAGQLTANGESGKASSGAGGSIQVTAGALAGNGIIAADGGSAGVIGSGGGGGGRIALYYGNSTFSGAVSALGGLASGVFPGRSGGAGTLYTQANGQRVGDLFLDNTGRTNAMETRVATPVDYRLTLANATAYATNRLTLSGLLVRANGLLTHPFQGPRLQVFVQGDAVVESGGTIGADMRGSPLKSGPGAGSGGGFGLSGSGAGHGGPGGASYYGAPGGVTYGSETRPVDFGSGGGGDLGPNRGGGAIQLTVTGTLTIDGRVSANADLVTASYDGGGSGGSIWLTSSRLDGTGSITANGQVSGYSLAGSGGGGRIAIDTGVNRLAGAVMASGGLSASRPGGNGTVHHGPNVPTGLVAWWRGEGDARDALGVHPGTAQGGVGFASAQDGLGFAFDSDDDRVVVPSASELNPGAAGFTAQFWMRGTRAQPDRFSALVDKSHGFTDSTGWTVHCWTNDGHVSFAIGQGGGGSGNFLEVRSHTDVLDGGFHQVTAVWTGTEAQLFVDGAMEDHQAAAPPANNTRPLCLGYAWGGGTPQRFFRGTLDEILIFNRSLGAAEVESLYFNQGGEVRLRIRTLSDGMQLSWPARASGFQLRTRSDLGPGDWESVPIAPVMNGDWNEVTIPTATPTQRFFRLVK